MRCLQCRDTGYVQISADCKNCNGTGEAECPHCGHETTCEDCNGTGKSGATVDCDKCDAARLRELPPYQRYLEETRR